MSTYGERRSSRVLALRQHAVDGIAPGKNADETPVCLGHQDSSDAAVAHVPASIFYCHFRRQRERLLVSHDI